jgi:hypothetical protein
MIEPGAETVTDLGDRVALELQRLFQSGRTGTDQGLLRIDFREEAAKAPFCFDMATGKLHQPGCVSLAASSGRARYGLWHPGSELRRLACERCRPSAREDAAVSDDAGSDIIYGVLSLVDQFRSVLKERGREYRNSPRGRQVSKDLGRLIPILSHAQRASVGLAVSSLEGLLQAIDELNRSMERQSRGLNGNGAGKRPRKPPQNGTSRRKEV